MTQCQLPAFKSGKHQRGHKEFILRPRRAPNIVWQNAWQVERGKQSSSEQPCAERDLFKIDLRVQRVPQNAVLEDQR